MTFWIQELMKMMRFKQVVMKRMRFNCDGDRVRTTRYSRGKECGWYIRAQARNYKKAPKTGHFMRVLLSKWAKRTTLLLLILIVGGLSALLFSRCVHVLAFGGVFYSSSFGYT
jgi:hypothetical protein